MILSHVSFTDNEKADQIAKSAENLLNITACRPYLLLYSDNTSLKKLVCNVATPLAYFNVMQSIVM